jgi:hypothetical protein
MGRLRIFIKEIELKQYPDSFSFQKWPGLNGGEHCNMDTKTAFCQRGGYILFINISSSYSILFIFVVMEHRQDKNEDLKGFY